MKTVLMLGVGCLLLATGASAAPALAQQADPSSQILQVQDRGGRFDGSDRSWSGRDRDRDRDQRRWSRDEDEDNDQSFGRGPGGSAMGLGRGNGGGMGQNRGAAMMMMHKHMMDHAGGARFHLRRGDSAIGVQCPADTPLNDCIDAVGRLLDRLNSAQSGSGSSTGSGSSSGSGSAR